MNSCTSKYYIRMQYLSFIKQKTCTNKIYLFLSGSFSSVSTKTMFAEQVSDFSSTTSSSTFDMDEELGKISRTCLSFHEQEELSGNIIRYINVFFSNFIPVNLALEIIAHREMRSALGFAPPGPWTHYKKPSEEDLRSASTPEEYFELKERDFDRSLDSGLFFEKNFPPAIAFLDKRFPAIRTICKRRFQEILRVNQGREIDRDTVDRIIHDYNEYIHPKMRNAIQNLYFQEVSGCIERTLKLERSLRCGG